MLRRLQIAGSVMALVLAIGTVGYRVAGLDWLSALYQTTVTVTTVGYADLAEPYDVKAFTILMAAFGAVTYALLISVLTGAVLETQLHEIIGRRKMEGKLRTLENHIILCGFGRFGRTIADEFRRKGTPFVVLEHDPVKARDALEHGVVLIEADATEEESLTKAGIERSQGLLTTLGSDAANVYVTLTAKQMQPGIKVVALAQDERSRAKLRAAGADEIVLPYALGGQWMVQVITSPTVADFVQMATGSNSVNFYMEEQRLAARSPLCGRALKDTPIRSELGITVVAIRRADGTLVTNPPPDLQLEPEDVLVSLGDQEKLAELKQLASHGA